MRKMNSGDYTDLREHIGVLSWKSARNALEKSQNNLSIPKKHEKRFEEINYLDSEGNLKYLGEQAYELCKDLEQNTDFEDLDLALIQIREEQEFKGFWNPEHRLGHLENSRLTRYGLISRETNTFYTEDGHYLKQRLKSFNQHL